MPTTTATDEDYVTKLTVEEVRQELLRVKRATEEALRRLDEYTKRRETSSHVVNPWQMVPRTMTYPTTLPPAAPPAPAGDAYTFPMGYSAPAMRCSCGRPAIGTYYPPFGPAQPYCENHVPHWGVVDPAPEPVQPATPRRWWSWRG